MCGPSMLRDMAENGQSFEESNGQRKWNKIFLRLSTTPETMSSEEEDRHPILSGLLGLSETTTVIQHAGQNYYLPSYVPSYVVKVKKSHSQSYEHVFSCGGTRRTITIFQLCMNEIKPQPEQWHEILVSEDCENPIAFRIANAHRFAFKGEPIYLWKFVNDCDETLNATEYYVRQSIYHNMPEGTAEDRMLWLMSNSSTGKTISCAICEKLFAFEQNSIRLCGVCFDRLLTTVADEREERVMKEITGKVGDLPLEYESAKFLENIAKDEEEMDGNPK